MNPMKDDLTKASKQIGLTESQIESLWQAFQTVQANKSGFNLSTGLIYAGSLIAFLSMTWFYTSNLNNTKSLFISIIYALTFFASSAYFWYAKKLRVQ
jgi:hypothetical protein